jgi:hypothetical protein
MPRAWFFDTNGDIRPITFDGSIGAIERTYGSIARGRIDLMWELLDNRRASVTQVVNPATLPIVVGTDDDVSNPWEGIEPNSQAGIDVALKIGRKGEDKVRGSFLVLSVDIDNAAHEHNLSSSPHQKVLQPNRALSRHFPDSRIIGNAILFAVDTQSFYDANGGDTNATTMVELVCAIGRMPYYYASDLPDLPDVSKLRIDWRATRW